MAKLTNLSLEGNSITIIQPNVFSGTHNLEKLDLSRNRLSEISTKFFTNLSSLRKLNLQDNGILLISPGSFSGMKSLEQLGLYGNKLGRLHAGTFKGLENLSTLVISNCGITSIDEEVFDPLINVKSLDLTDNPFTRIPKNSFRNLDLDYIYFDKFYMCAYAGHVKECSPRGDGISSQENLLENIVLRVSVWIVAVLACAGNIVVLLGRFLLKEDNQIHSFFIKNLSLADMLMGIYLLVIGARDKMYRGDYVFHDEEWRNSWECDMSGVLSTVSSEMSVMTLTVITLDRYISIMYPLSFRKRGLKVAYLVMASLWLIAILLGVIPLVGLDYFGSSFYRDNGVCIPLHLHNPHAKGWQYSAILFLGVNFISFSFITYAYTAMFLSIQRSAVPLRTTRESRERCLVKRFFFIVITDFACWIPIIVIKVLALAGVEISGNLYAWVVVFVLPVNSALNPLLYTLTTKLFKQKLLSKFSSVVWRPQTPKETSHSCSSVRGRTSAVSNRHVLNDYEMECLRKCNKKEKGVLKKPTNGEITKTLSVEPNDALGSQSH